MVEKSGGVFLWIALVLKEIRALVRWGASQGDLVALLKELPLDLKGMYCSMVKDLVGRMEQPFQKTTIERGVQMLTWAAFSERFLSIEEFQDAIAISLLTVSGVRNSDFKFATSRTRDLAPYIQACCAFLEIRVRVVQLLHLAAREFLLTDGIAEPFKIDQSMGEKVIASGCLRYLGLLVQESSATQVAAWTQRDYDQFVGRLSGFPLLEYVVVFLPRHLASIKSRAIETSVLEEAPLFLCAPFRDHAVLYLFESWARRCNLPREKKIVPGLR